ncbi:MAG: glycosyltransferase family 2 protein [Candidatus Omnitrophica bacterium]|nr:glycosyltransferase family 2 protein [Candidatus Omnitrophota bacterium]
MIKRPMFTVFTPTYNRLHTLSRVYESLKQQTYQDFEWLIVDDGSSDGTNYMVGQWQKEGLFTIRYFYQKNKGKHTAYNLAIEHALGELFVTLDSDDAFFLKDSLRIVYDDWIVCLNTQPNKLAGLLYLSCFANGKIIGTKFPRDVIDGRIFDINDRFRVSGDKITFILTSIAVQYPFPVFPDELFCPEGLVWNRISRDYLFRHINTVIQLVEYQPDGLSANSFLVRKRSKNGTILYYSEVFLLPLSKFAIIRNYANLYRFCLHYRKKVPHIIGEISFFYIAVSALLGLGLYYKDCVTERWSAQCF